MKFTSFPSFPCVLGGILEGEIFPTQAQGNTGCFEREKIAKIHGNHLEVGGRDGHCFIKTKNQYQRTWKALEITENCHGGHDLKTPIFHFLWVLLCGFTDAWRKTMNSETSYETPVCWCVFLGVFVCCKPPLCTPHHGNGGKSYPECTGESESSFPGTGAGVGTNAKLVLGLFRCAWSPRQDCCEFLLRILFGLMKLSLRDALDLLSVWSGGEEENRT